MTEAAKVVRYSETGCADFECSCSNKMVVDESGDWVKFDTLSRSFVPREVAEKALDALLKASEWAEAHSPGAALPFEDAVQESAVTLRRELGRPT